MDAERIGPERKMAQAHPEWLAKRYDGVAELGGLIDLANPEAAHWMEEQIVRLIAENDLDFFRLDYNVGGLGAGSQDERFGFVENAYWRYYEALYGIYDRLRVRFPRVIFENCAGGGGRTDLGLVRYFNHTWITDWQIAPRSFSIVNGMTMALRRRGSCVSGREWGNRSTARRNSSFSAACHYSCCPRWGGLILRA